MHNSEVINMLNVVNSFNEVGCSCSFLEFFISLSNRWQYFFVKLLALVCFGYHNKVSQTGGIRQEKVVSPFWRLGPPSVCWRGGLWGRACLMPLSSLLLATFGVWWLVDTLSHQPLPPLHVAFSLWAACIYTCPFYKDTCHIGWGPTLVTSSEQITTVRPYFQIRSFSEYWGLGFQNMHFGKIQFNLKLYIWCCD